MATVKMESAMWFTALENKNMTESIARLLNGLSKAKPTKIMIFGVEGSSLAVSLNHQHVILVPDYAYKAAKEQKKLSNAL